MKKALIIIAAVLAVLLGIFFYLTTWKVTNIQVSGCVLSSEQDIKEAILASGYKDNIITIYMKHKFKPIVGIPFVEKMDMDFKSKDTIVVEVYEKSVTGCVEYMDSYVFFDKDGIVLEAGKEKKERIPIIDGLNYTEWALNHELPVDNKENFRVVLDISQLLAKYELPIQRVNFMEDGEIELTSGDILIQLGYEDNLTVKMMNLKNILEPLKGKKGVLYMKDYDKDTQTASFKSK